MHSGCPVTRAPELPGDFEGITVATSEERTTLKATLNFRCLYMYRSLYVYIYIIYPFVSFSYLKIIKVSNDYDGNDSI